MQKKKINKVFAQSTLPHLPDQMEWTRIAAILLLSFWWGIFEYEIRDTLRATQSDGLPFRTQAMTICPHECGHKWWWKKVMIDDTFGVRSRTYQSIDSWGDMLYQLMQNARTTTTNPATKKFGHLIRKIGLSNAGHNQVVFLVNRTWEPMANWQKKNGNPQVEGEWMLSGCPHHRFRCYTRVSHNT